MRNYKDLEIWKAAMDTAVKIYKICEQLPDDEKYGLRSQITRAAVSVPSNIAEGCRGTEKEFIQFLRISIGSMNEIETQFTIAKRINYISPSTADELLHHLNILRSKTINLIKYTKKK